MNLCTSYKPGDEGFEDLCKKITDIRKIKGEQKRLILADETCYHKGRRNESSGKV